MKETNSVNEKKLKPPEIEAIVKRIIENWQNTEDNQSMIHSINDDNCHPLHYFSQLDVDSLTSVSSQILIHPLWSHKEFFQGPVRANQNYSEGNKGKP